MRTLITACVAGSLALGSLGAFAQSGTPAQTPQSPSVTREGGSTNPSAQAAGEVKKDVRETKPQASKAMGQGSASKSGTAAAGSAK